MPFWCSTAIQQSVRAWITGSGGTSSGSPWAAAVEAPPRAPPPAPAALRATGDGGGEGAAVVEEAGGPLTVDAGIALAAGG